MFRGIMPAAPGGRKKNPGRRGGGAGPAGGQEAGARRATGARGLLAALLADLALDRLADALDPLGAG
jgi:hypothetical protein